MPSLVRLSVVFFAVILSACSSYGVISNTPLKESIEEPYDLRWSVNREQGRGDTAIVLAFSGGGTRAAALAYGVLHALNEIEINVNGQSSTLLDEVDLISSVSGGSFTSAYYGLYGKRIFDDFEHAFLRQDIRRQLLDGLFSPRRWFSSLGRTEMAIDNYNHQVFNDATFADLQAANGPFIIINASDLSQGNRFAFTQDYFNLLCSDIRDYPIARAVAASSAVPVVFNPVMLANHGHCNADYGDYLQSIKHRDMSSQTRHLQRSLASYANKQQRPFVHLVDGGITDNLGLVALSDSARAVGGIEPMMNYLGAGQLRRVLVISVNASAVRDSGIDETNRVPSIEQTVSAMSNAQLKRYNAATLDQSRATFARWAKQLSSEQNPIDNYFVEVSFEQIEGEAKRNYFNAIPTSFTLSNGQVDQLIDAGRDLLLRDRAFRRFMKETNARFRQH